MDTSAFDRLFSRNVPHILEKIFFYLDYNSFQQCVRVNTTWHELLASDSYRKKAKSLFCKEILKDQRKLLKATSLGNTENVKSLLCGGMLDVNFVDPHNGFSALLHASRSGNLDVMKLLLDMGAEPNKRKERGPFPGWTPLHFACFGGYLLGTVSPGYERGNEHLEDIELLLERGADPTLRDDDGRIPLYWVIGEPHQEVVNLMIERGLDPNERCLNLRHQHDP